MSAAEHRAAEYAQQLDALLSFLADTYVEVAGQAEGLRTVVSDLRSSLAYLHSRSTPNAPPDVITQPGSAHSPAGAAPSHTRPSTPPHVSASPAEAHTKPKAAPAASRVQPAAHRAAPTSARVPPSSSTRSMSGRTASQRQPASQTSVAKQPSLSRQPSSSSRTGRIAPKAPVSLAADQEGVGVISRACLEQACSPLLTPLTPSSPTSNTIPAAPASVTSTQGPNQAPTNSPLAPHTPVGRPSLSVSYRRALARHQEALQAGFALCKQHTPNHTGPQHLYHQSQRQIDSQGSSFGLQCSEDAMLQGAVDSVTSASQSFLGSLTQYYGTCGEEESGPSTARPSTAGAPHTGVQPANTHDLDVTHVALVAAQTWLLQALSKVPRPGSKQSQNPPSGTSPSHLLQLLHSLPRLKAQLAAQQAAFTRRTAKQNSAVTADEQSEEAEVDAAAAAQWRNRFLRAALAGKGAARSDEGDAASYTIPRPLGLWLPDACFLPLLHSEHVLAALPHPYGTSSPTHDPRWAALLQQAPWLLALPTTAAAAVAAGRDGSTGPSKALIPQHSYLVAAFPAAGVSHARSQMQLQLHLLHSWIESRLAAPLLPDPAYLQMCVQQQQERQAEAHGGRNKAGDMSSDLARVLAAWRLSHTFLCKNSWNRSPFIVETV